MPEDHRRRLPRAEWNIYLFHFSDGDNWSGDDTADCVRLLEQLILPRQPVLLRPGRSPYGSGQFIKDLEGWFPQEEKVALSEIRDRDGIVGSIKDFWERGADHGPPARTSTLPAGDQRSRYARATGLDFFPTIFEILTYDEMNEVAAYGGFPDRYPHWRFGMEYELSKGYAYGLHEDLRDGHQQQPLLRLPARRQLQVDQKLVMAHVYGHGDFFKNNLVRQTNRKMMDEMANHATQVQRAVERYGLGTVEAFLDSCLSIENLTDPSVPFAPQPRAQGARRVAAEERPQEEELTPACRAKRYMDSFINPKGTAERQRRTRGRRRRRSAASARAAPATSSGSCRARPAPER